MSNRLMKELIARAAVVLAVAVPAVALSGVPPAAATGPAPGTGVTGACNMGNAWGAGAQGGMAHAMSVDNAHGNAGMSTAVERSGC
jgi:hypothetical protein